MIRLGLEPGCPPVPGVGGGAGWWWWARARQHVAATQGQQDGAAGGGGDSHASMQVAWWVGLPDWGEERVSALIAAVRMWRCGPVASLASKRAAGPPSSARQAVRQDIRLDVYGYVELQVICNIAAPTAHLPHCQQLRWNWRRGVCAVCVSTDMRQHGSVGCYKPRSWSVAGLHDVLMC